MSLIADALRAAQEERAENARGAGTPAERRIAASALGTSARLRTRGPGTHALDLPRPLGVALFCFGGALVLAGTVLIQAPARSAVPTRPPAHGADLPAGTFPNQGFVDAPAAGAGPEDLTDPPDLLAGPWFEDLYDAGDAEALGGGGVDHPPSPEAQMGTEASGETTGPSAVENGETIRNAAAGPQAENSTAAAPTRLEPPPAPPAAGTEGRFRLTVSGGAAGAARGFESAVLLQKRGDHVAAVREYEGVLRREPDHVAALTNLGLSLHALGELERARSSFERAVAIDPGFAPAWSNLGIALGELRLDAKARAALEEAIRLDPLGSGPRVNLATLLHRQGAGADARRVLEEVLRRDPSHAEARYALARILEESGDHTGASVQYQLFLASAGERFSTLHDAVRQRIEELRVRYAH